MSSFLALSVLLAGLSEVERTLITGTLDDALRCAVEAEDEDARETLRPSGGAS